MLWLSAARQKIVSWFSRKSGVELLEPDPLLDPHDHLGLESLFESMLCHDRKYDVGSTGKTVIWGIWLADLGRICLCAWKPTHKRVSIWVYAHAGKHPADYVALDLKTHSDLRNALHGAVRLLEAKHARA